MAAQVVPVTSAPGQSFLANLLVDQKQLQLNLTFNYAEVAGSWIMTVEDAKGNLLADSVPLVTGGYPAANLLEQQRYLAIGSAYLLNVSNDPGDIPGSNNLGSDYVLIWDDTPPS